MTSNNILWTHNSYFGKETKIPISKIKLGDVIKFMYEDEEKVAFVVNPEYKTMLHGLSLDVISRRDLMVEVIARSNTIIQPDNLYEQVLNRDVIKKIDCYRTYKLYKMQNIRRMEYYIDERGMEYK